MRDRTGRPPHRRHDDSAPGKTREQHRADPLLSARGALLISRLTSIPRQLSTPSDPRLLLADAHYFDDDALAALAVELGVENLFPPPEIERATRDRHDDLMPHDRPLQVRVGVVFTRLMMLIREPGRRE